MWAGWSYTFGIGECLDRLLLHLHGLRWQRPIVVQTPTGKLCVDGQRFCETKVTQKPVDEEKVTEEKVRRRVPKMLWSEDPQVAHWITLQARAAGSFGPEPSS